MENPSEEFTVKSYDFIYLHGEDRGKGKEEALPSEIVKLTFSRSKVTELWKLNSPPYVIDYLNGVSFFQMAYKKRRKAKTPKPLEYDGVVYEWEEGEPTGSLFTAECRDPTLRWSEAQRKIFIQQNSPTEAQRGLLKAFVDTFLVAQDEDERLGLIGGGEYHYKDTIILERREENGGMVGEIHRFDSAYDLFFFECIEMYRRGQRVYRCKRESCGKYFFSKNGRPADFCSGACRSANNENKSPEYKAYRKACDAKRTYASRHKEDTELQKRFARWNNDAYYAMGQVTDGKMTMEELAVILNEDIKTGGGNGNE